MLEIPERIYQAIVEQARSTAPLECCGLLAGKGGRVTDHFPLRNELASPVEYLGEARDMLAAFHQMRESDLDLVAIYHSHPSSEPVPSRTDLERNQYPDTLHLIISLWASEPIARAYRLKADSYQEIAWRTI